MGESIAMVLYGLATIILFVGLIFWAASVQEHNAEEFEPSKVGDLEYDEETKVMRFTGGRTGHKYEYVGSGTVWYSPDGHRMGISMEASLSEIYHYWKVSQ